MPPESLLLEDGRLKITQEILDDIQFHLKEIIIADNKTPGYDAFGRYLDNYKKNTLRKESLKLYRLFLLEDVSCRASTIERTLKGEKGGEKYVPSYALIDFLCYACWKKRLHELILDNRYIQSEEIYRVSIPKYATRPIQQRLKETTNDLRTATKLAEPLIDRESGNNSQIPSNIIWVTPQYFAEALADDGKAFIEYYLRFNNSLKCLRTIIALDKHVSPQTTFEVKIEGKPIVLDITDIINTTSIGNPTLVMIMGVGGAGKSTLLWHLMKKLCSQYRVVFMRRVSADTLKEAFQQEVGNEPAKPTLLFLDDLVSRDENRDNLLDFVDTLAELCATFRITVVAAERYYRYDRYKDKGEFENIFTGGRFTIQYSNEAIKRPVFENIFSQLKVNGKPLSTKIREECFRVFNSSKFDSLIDSAFNLMVYLKREYTKINYKFDWEDWRAACTGRFIVLNDLFKVVAFFYQFGVTVSLDFIRIRLSPLRIDDLLRELLGTFQAAYSPIIITRNQRDEPVLSLRHEKMAEWYFQITPGGIDSAKDFFSDFIAHVRTTSSAYLFRNLIRYNSEFILSPYKQMISNKTILDVIEQYLHSQERYSESEYKMLMEKHFVLINLGRTEDSLEPLEEILKFDKDNVFAMTRIALMIQDVDVSRAEDLYTKVLAIENENYRAQFGLLRLHFYSGDVKKFEHSQTAAFSFANKKLKIANKLISYLEKNFTRLPFIIVGPLLDLYRTHKELGIAIADLLINMGHYKESLNLLLEIETTLINKGVTYKNRVASLFIKLYTRQSIDDNRSIKAAERIVNTSRVEQPKNAETIFLLAKLASIDRLNPNYKQAEELFDYAFELDQGGRVFGEILRFYRNNAAYIVDSGKGSSPKAITVLLRGVKFAQEHLQSPFGNTNANKLDLCIVLNELAYALFSHSRPLNDEHGKYPPIITSIENKCEEILDEVLEGIEKMLPQVGETLFSNYVADEKSVLLLAKGCSIAYEFYKGKADRFAKKALSDAEAVKLQSLYLNAKTILEKSLLFDDDNPKALTNYIDVKISLGDSDVSATLATINYSRFNVREKARFCRILIKRGYHEDGIALIRKFGALDSANLKVKHDLTLCYIEAEMWGCAVSVLVNIKEYNKYTLGYIRRLAFEIPITTSARADARVRFSKMHIEWHPGKLVREMIENVCKTLFISSDKLASFNYFQDNWQYFKIPRGTTNSERAFSIISRDWQPSLVDFLAKNISIPENMVSTDPSYYPNALALIDKYLQNLLSIDLDFQIINYNHKNEDEFYEKIKTIILKSINIVFKIVNSGSKYGSDAVQLCMNFIQMKNPLFDKVFLSKLLKSLTILLQSFQKIIEYFERGRYTDADILRMIGRCNLLQFQFFRAERFFLLGMRFAQSNIQQSYSHVTLADWIVTKIEEEDLLSFRPIAEIRQKLREARNHINTAESLFLWPNSKYKDKLLIRLKVLESIY